MFMAAFIVNRTLMMIIIIKWWWRWHWLHGPCHWQWNHFYWIYGLNEDFDWYYTTFNVKSQICIQYSNRNSKRQQWCAEINCKDVVYTWKSEQRMYKYNKWNPWWRMWDRKSSTVKLNLIKSQNLFCYFCNVLSSPESNFRLLFRSILYNLLTTFRVHRFHQIIWTNKKGLLLLTKTECVNNFVFQMWLLWGTDSLQNVRRNWKRSRDS